MDEGVITMGTVSGVYGPDVQPDELSPGDPAVAVFAPESAILRMYSHSSNPGESARNHWSGVVSGIAHSGGKINITATIAGDNEVTVPITPASFAELGIDYGDRIVVVTKALQVNIYPHAVAKVPASSGAEVSATNG